MRTLRRVCALGLLLAVSCVPALALSQDQPQDRADRPREARPAGSSIEEIVISRPQGGTASVQDVSISVSAFAAETLDRKALSNVADIGDLAPNVDIDKTSPFSGSSSVLSPFVRGIGQNDFAFNLEPGVGVYVDGVYFARTIGAVVDLLDLDRVEILKGPQGTVFGRNTIGGALNIITRRPSDSFDYRGDVTIGRFDRIDVRGAIDVPIQAETLVSQFSFSSKRRDGYQKRVSFPGGPFNSDETLFSRARYATPGKSGGEHQDNFRGKFVWNARDTLELTFAGDYSTVDEDGIPGSLVNSNAGPGAMTVAGAYNACISTPPAALAMWGLDAVCGPRGLAPTRTNPTAGSNPLPGLAGVNVDGDPSNDRPVFGNQFISDKDVSFATGSNFSKIDASGLSVTANMDVAEGLALKSISAFRRLSADFGTDLDGSPIDIGDTSFSTNQRQYSQELQLIGSSFQKRLDWVLGAYYFHEKGDLTDFVPFGEGLVQVDGENLFKNIAYAAFTNLTYSVTDAFAVSFGLRFTDEHKDFEGRQRDLNSLPFKMGFPAQAFPDPSDVTRIYPIGTQRREFDDFTTRVALEYSLTDDIFSYASFSQGTKSGGFTTRLLVPEPMPNVAPDFDTEKADSYEIGLKTQLFGRRLQANLAAFYTQYDDIQVTVQRNISPTFENAGEGVIRGIELEFQSLVTDRLRLDGGLGILDAEYSDLEPETVLDRSDRFVNTPDFSANLNGSYAIPIDLEGGPLALDGELTVQADYTHKSNIANDAENNPFFFTDHVNVVNASLTWAPNAPTRIGSWELTLGVRNLTDTRYVVSGFENPGIGFTFANFSRPREWYLSVRFRR